MNKDVEDKEEKATYQNGRDVVCQSHPQLRGDLQFLLLLLDRSRYSMLPWEDQSMQRIRWLHIGKRNLYLST